MLLKYFPTYSVFQYTRDNCQQGLWCVFENKKSASVLSKRLSVDWSHVLAMSHELSCFRFSIDIRHIRNQSEIFAIFPESLKLHLKMSQKGSYYENPGGNEGANYYSTRKNVPKKPSTRVEKNIEYPEAARDFLTKIGKVKRECHVDSTEKNLLLVSRKEIFP